ncbi:late blight resistance protein R1-A-like [Nicotiana sylvestris]|uniref:late blight resistance protein R1-A-like n=1 Tax=Nicotiana sylvestris TaxID=4096 RepID=UPI00388CB870
MSSDQYLSSKNIYPLLQSLQAIEEQRWYLFLLKTSKEQTKFLKREIKFLNIFLSFQSFTDEFSDVTQEIKTLFRDVVLDLSKVHEDPDSNFDPFISQDGVATSKIVLQFVDAVVSILGDLVQIDDPHSLLFVLEPKDQIKEVLKELNLLRFFVCFVSNKHIEPQSQHIFFTHVFIVAVHAAMVAWLCLPSPGNNNKDVAPTEMNALLFDLLQMKIKPINPGIRKIYGDVLQALKSTIQPEWNATDSGFAETVVHNLVELPTVSNRSSIVSLNDQMAILREMLILLRDHLIHLPILNLDLCLQDMDTVIVDAGLVIYSLYDSDTALEDVGQVLGLDLLGDIQPIRAMTYLIIRKAFEYNLPRIHGLGYVDFLLNNLKEFQGRYANSLASIRIQLQIIEKELESLQPFLKAVAEEQHNKLETLQDYATELISKAYEVEYVVDAYISKEVPHWCLGRWLLDIVEEITRIKVEVAEIQEKKMVEDIMNASTARMSSNLARTPRMNEEIVGFEDVIEKLRDQLIKGTKGRDVISIVGMPGLVYSRKHLLLEILRDATNEHSKHREKRDDELADELRKTLYSKRYLILIDDVWEASAWDDLIGCFQDANNGSRIILTTRNHELANYTRFQSDPLSLRMFDDVESWKLLETKVFGEDSCPPLLMNIGQQITKECGQLPLSIVLVAGILVETEQKAECWEEIANNLGPHIHSDSRAIIEQTFLEDSVINVSKLTWLWISEGFVKSCEGKSLEDIAEGYLENLIGRNLVMGTRSSGGNIKACHIHDLLHDFCKERAKEENLLLWIKREQNANPSSCMYSHKQLSHCISIYGEEYFIGEWSSSCSLVGSVLMLDDCLTFNQVSRILHSFKFLNVLNLEFTKIDSFPTDLVYLRYFAAYISGIPSSICNLWNLETMILKYGGRLSLPITVWKMVKLRHLHNIQGSLDMKNAEGLLENSAKLYDLETLSTVYFSCQLSEIVLLQNLQVLKLKLIRYDNKEWKVSNGEFPQLKVLKLQDLYFLLEEWIVAEDAFPNLERLVLRECKKLKEIPSCFGVISSLKSIEVQECNDCVDKSASIIQEMQVEDYQNTKFKLFLK